MSRIKLPKLELHAFQREGVGCELPLSAVAKWNPELRAQDEGNSISIFDPIGSDFFGEGMTAKKMAAAIKEIGNEQITVNINSPGGDVFEGIAIYNLLRDHPRKVTVRVIGLAASAASIIAMAGDQIEIARAGFMMIHNVWVAVVGNRNDLAAASEMLQPFDDALADVYATRTKNEKAAIADLMDKETWFSGTQAVEQGFADELLPADQVDSADSGNATKAALRFAEAAFAKAGVPRAQRRSLIRQLTGTPSAAETVTPSADEGVAEFLAAMEKMAAGATH